MLDFLRTHDADTIYLVGDIVDGWALKSSWYWPQSHNDFVQKMLRKARRAPRSSMCRGNHDEFLRNYYGTHFGGIDVVENTIHEALTANAISSSTATSSISWCRTRAGSPILATRPMTAIQMNRLVFFRRMFIGALLVVVAMGEAKVKNAVNYIARSKRPVG